MGSSDATSCVVRQPAGRVPLRQPSTSPGAVVSPRPPRLVSRAFSNSTASHGMPTASCPGSGRPLATAARRPAKRARPDLCAETGSSRRRPGRDTQRCGTWGRRGGLASDGRRGTTGLAVCLSRCALGTACRHCSGARTGLQVVYGSVQGHRSQDVPRHAAETEYRASDATARCMPRPVARWPVLRPRRDTPAASSAGGGACVCPS